MPKKCSTSHPGTRKYGTKSNYTNSPLQEALAKIKLEKISIGEAFKIYKVPKATLFYKLKSEHLTKDWPIGINDFKSIVKIYLNDSGKNIQQFKDNRPGWKWCKLYLDRHPSLKEKVSHCISINYCQIKLFFQNLEKELNGVTPDNIYNMDETGFHDDPGKLIPPFFIVKGKHSWSDWPFNALEGSRKATSCSAWIEIQIFEEWLLNHFVPNIINKEGKKVLICDNISGHISLKALNICEKHNITFICLVPNSTHLLQPLDVGYFSSLKADCRSVFNQWRKTSRGKKGKATEVEAYYKERDNKKISQDNIRAKRRGRPLGSNNMVMKINKKLNILQSSSIVNVNQVIEDNEQVLPVSQNDAVFSLEQVVIVGYNLIVS
ncbi:uncharacterized protein LOC136096591 [Hydra vulgaris]|uniref:uncharacterized protein LOC136096591 n=1 Tax=Hydra vulgaris TaxID=6087 RepID=UPI0032E9C3F5